MAIELVTSENREEYLKKKMAEKAGVKPMEMDEKAEQKARAKKMNNEELERVKKHPKYAKLVIALGKKGAMDALLKEMNEKQ